MLDPVSRGEIFTTSVWYWRLGRAVAQQGSGALSRAFARLDDERRALARRALSELPPEIGMIPPRRLIPLMAALPGQLNMLTAEAVAAAVVLQARIAVTTPSPLLTGAATAVDIPVDILDLG